MSAPFRLGEKRRFYETKPTSRLLSSGITSMLRTNTDSLAGHRVRFSSLATTTGCRRGSGRSNDYSWVVNSVTAPQSKELPNGAAFAGHGSRYCGFGVAAAEA